MLDPVKRMVPKRKVLYFLCAWLYALSHEPFGTGKSFIDGGLNPPLRTYLLAWRLLEKPGEKNKVFIPKKWHSYN